MFGGLVSDDFTFARPAVFVNRNAYRDRLALAAFAGDIRPKTSLAAQVTVPSMYSPRVTKSRDNIIERVDGIGFADYLRKVGYEPMGLKGLPLSFHVQPPDDAPPETSAMLYVDQETGNGVFSRAVPENASIGICCLTAKDIKDSTAACLAGLLPAMAEEEASGYRFGTVIAVSCISRYYAMMGDRRTEAEQIASALAGRLDTFGFYSFGEICPIRSANGAQRNCSHSHALALCAF